jgi:VCBS repeat-containing protein
MTTVAEYELEAALSGANVIHGTDGVDNPLTGTAGFDFIDGGLGDDSMIGGFGDDTYVVDSQFDQILEGFDGGIDTVISTAGFFELPANVEILILAGDGDISGNGNDLGNELYGNDGRNTLAGNDLPDRMDGRSGDDFLIGDGGDDQLYGGDDALGAQFVGAGPTGLSNTDYLDGGAGNDALDGGSGDDLLFGGDGNDRLSGGDNGTGAADGTFLSNNDFLDGGAGDDVMTGGTGDDFLTDAAGNDTYVFGPGHGSDMVMDLGGDADRLVLNGGLTPDDVGFERVGDDLLVTLNGSTDSVQVAGYFSGGHIEAIEFADGTVYDTAAVETAIAAANANHAPEARDDAAGVVEDGAPVSRTAGGNVLANDGDPDAGTVLAVTNPGTYAGAYGTLLLAADGTFTYTLDNAAAQALGAGETVTESFAYTVTDGHPSEPLTDDGTIAVTVAGANDAPVLVSALADRTVAGTSAFSFTVPGTAFTDVDGDALAYGATLSGGAALPSWLGFNAATRTFSGTPPASLLGQSIEVKVTADDGHGGTATDVFKLTFEGGQGRRIVGTRRDDRLVGTDYDDTIDGKGGSDTMLGGKGDDTYYVDRKPDRRGRRGDKVVENPGEGYDTVIASASYALPANVEVLRLAGKATEGKGNGLDNVIVGNDRSNRLYGEGGDDLVRGGKGNDRLQGGSGLDVLEGGRGNDRLTDSRGASLLNGGDGRDVLEGSCDASFYVGGRGDDKLRLAGDGDVVAFNRGDGRDVVAFDGARDATLSLGGGIRYQDLALRKSGSDLVVEVGSGERIVLDDWYRGRSNQSVKTLQVFAAAMPGFDEGGCDDKVEMFDFRAIVRAYDAAREADCDLDRWRMMNELLDTHLAGSDDAALGGDLAYQYGLRGSLAGVGLIAAQEVLGAPTFGAAPQALQSQGELAAGPVKLG